MRLCLFACLFWIVNIFVFFFINIPMGFFNFINIFEEWNTDLFSLWDIYSVSLIYSLSFFILFLIYLLFLLKLPVMEAFLLFSAFRNYFISCIMQLYWLFSESLWTFKNNFSDYKSKCTFCETNGNYIENIKKEKTQALLTLHSKDNCY